VTSFEQSQHDFDSHELEVINLALVGAVAVCHELGVSEDVDPPLQERLFAIASDGVDNPRSLRNRVLKTIDLG
jgi:hypothetical protein